jgi:hypothetical protein
VGAGICCFLAPQIVRITTNRYTLIASFMIGIIFFAAFQAKRNWGDLIALLLFSGVVGFVLEVATFITLFLRHAAKVDWWKAVFGGAGFVLFLGILSHQLTLRYPTGLLQEFITLPWPLQ